MSKEYWIVDAFTTRAFAGNPAAVVILEKIWPDDEWLQHVAAEFNLSETAFVLEAGPDGGRGLRWFTPTIEVPLCGHATLAAAHALRGAARAPDERTLLFDSKSGRLACR